MQNSFVYHFVTRSKVHLYLGQNVKCFSTHNTDSMVLESNALGPTKDAKGQGLLEFIWTEGWLGQSSNPGPALAILSIKL